MRLLSTPTVSSVPGEYNYFSAVANVIITAVASRYCTTQIYHSSCGKQYAVCPFIWLACIQTSQVIKTFSTREGLWYIGIKGVGCVKSKGTS